MPTCIVWILKQKGYCHPLLPKAQNYIFRFQQKTCKSLTEIMIACPSNGCQVQKLYIPLTPTVWMMLLERKKVICFVWTLQSPGFSFYSPILFPSRKRNCLKGKGFSIPELEVRFSCSLVEFTTVVTAFNQHHTWFGITSNLIHFSGFGLSYEVTVMLLQSSFLWIF